MSQQMTLARGCCSSKLGDLNGLIMMMIRAFAHLLNDGAVWM